MLKNLDGKQSSRNHRKKLSTGAQTTGFWISIANFNANRFYISKNIHFEIYIHIYNFLNISYSILLPKVFLDKH